MKSKIIEFPKFSWERPIEEETIEFCNLMARNFRGAEASNRETGWFANNSFSRECGAMALAYETVAKHIKDQLEIRKRI